MSESFERELEILIDRFHAQERLRIWSLVITIFGDAVLPRGGEFWLGSLQELMERLRIEPNALRAAMSRLTADGWLTRLRVGRNSYYQLAETGKIEFAAGTRKIYAPQQQSASGEWTIIVLTGEAGSGRDARRVQLRSAGFGSLSPTIFVQPGRAPALTQGSKRTDELVFHSKLADDCDAPSLLTGAWALDEIAASYGSLVEVYSPLATALKSGAEPAPLSAMVARSLLIHSFRRAALRDPHFPVALRPAGWAGDAARQLVSQIYRYLAAPSEHWLDTCSDSGGNPLQKPQFDVSSRFDN